MLRRPRTRLRTASVVRWLAAAVVGAIAVAYVQPVRAYLDARADVTDAGAEQAALLERRATLERRVAHATTDAFVEREARRIGLVRPGETLYIVKGIERWKRAHVP